MLGYTCRRETFESCADAVATLGERVAEGPVLVGPVDMGLLAHQPGSDRASGADHFVVALEVTDREVVFHDPQGHPWAALPHDVFSAAWRAEQIGYATGSYAMRSAFEQREEVALEDALARSLKAATGWLAGRDLPVPPGTIGGRPGLERLTDLVDNGFDEDLAELLSQFSVRLGARRRTDAATCYAGIGFVSVAELLQEQARELGRLQYPATTRDGRAVAAGLRRLGQLHDALAEEVRNAA